MTIPVARPYFDSSEEAAVINVLRSGWISHGPACLEFERIMAAKIGVAHARVVNSGTSAIQLALIACGVAPGDEVIVPAFTCAATIFPVENLGAEPVVVDIELKSYGLDPDKLQAAITERTKAIIVVHLFGLAANLAPILEIARRNSIPVIEDAALGLGARIGERWAGSFGRVACLSFHPRKIISTGEGGMVLTNDESIASRVAELRAYGASVSAWERHNRSVSAAPAYARPGFNMKMTDIQAAVGIEQVRKLDSIIASRQAIAHRYDAAIRDTSWLSTPDVPAGRSHVYQSYVVLARGPRGSSAGGMLGQRLMFHLQQHGIASVPAAQSIPALGLFRERYGWEPETYPAARLAGENAIALPIFPTLSDLDQNVVISAVASFDPGDTSAGEARRFKAPHRLGR